MKPPPPSPEEYGSVTPRVAAAATAASTALPPWRSTASPAWEASRSTVEIAPPVPRAVGWLAGEAARDRAGATRPLVRAREMVRAASRTAKRRCILGGLLPDGRGWKSRGQSV